MFTSGWVPFINWMSTYCQPCNFFYYQLAIHHPWLVSHFILQRIYQWYLTLIIDMHVRVICHWVSVSIGILMTNATWCLSLWINLQSCGSMRSWIWMWFGSRWSHTQLVCVKENRHIIWDLFKYCQWNISYNLHWWHWSHIMMKHFLITGPRCNIKVSYQYRKPLWR